VERQAVCRGAQRRPSGMHAGLVEDVPAGAEQRSQADAAREAGALAQHAQDSVIRRQSQRVT